MYGAITGDIIGSTFEFTNLQKKRNFALYEKGSDFTDDTIMTIAVARALMQWKQQGGDLEKAMVKHMKLLGRKYLHPKGSYGRKFFWWILNPWSKPYNSYGNGSAMRVSPCGLIGSTMEETLELARASAVVSHNHPEGIKGAQATAAAVFLAKSGKSKGEIREYIERNFYKLDRTVEEICDVYQYDGSCQGSVPESIIAFLESENYVDAIRNAISMGGDADTMAAIAGGIAWSYDRAQNDGELTEDMVILVENTEEYLPLEFRRTIEEFEKLCQ